MNRKDFQALAGFSHIPLPLALLISLLVALLVALVASEGAAQVGPSVTPGFPNLPQVPGTVLSGLNAPQQGRTAIIAYHNGILFTVPEGTL